MIVIKCGSPLGEYEIHCDEKDKVLIESVIDHHRSIQSKMQSQVDTRTGITCSCVCDVKNWKFFFCLKHKKEIFGLDLKDYELFRTDADREI